MASTFTAMSALLWLLLPGIRNSQVPWTICHLFLPFHQHLSAEDREFISENHVKPKVCARAKDVYFNKDGSAIKKLQVRLRSL